MALIVVADDDRLTRVMVRTALESGGHTVLDACDGYECLDRIQSAQPDLAIIDMFMPEMDGLETVAEIRTQNPNLKIIAMSSGGTRVKMTYLDAMHDMGANQVVAKPIKATHLLDLVETVLGLPQAV